MGSTAEFVAKEVNGSTVDEKKVTVVFVLGGPGSGKGTQCANIVTNYGFTHLSAGDLLREEIQSGSTNGYDALVNTHIVPEFVLFFDCSEEEMERRLLGRNQGRVDDNIETIRKRFKVFLDSTLPVINYYDSLGKVKKINAGKPIEEVFEAVKSEFSPKF